eukprot:TRINITY_DN7445_c0_g1_i1.p1 TRINITY_DN7445_c0_g1~~TRINITY_DN7445_c0_g1_i1.p1  ORF type:complete len:415 (+),score=128.84 TRINITY_DN7445_c0_g1_i1:85-1329(+)
MSESNTQQEGSLNFEALNRAEAPRQSPAPAVAAGRLARSQTPARQIPPPEPAQFDFSNYLFILALILVVAIGLGPLLSSGSEPGLNPEQAFVGALNSGLAQSNSLLEDASEIAKIHDDFAQNLNLFQGEAQERLQKIQEIHATKVFELNTQVHTQIGKIKEELATDADIPKADEIWKAVKSGAMDIVTAQLKTHFETLIEDTAKLTAEFEQSVEVHLANIKSEDAKTVAEAIAALEREINAKFVKKLNDTKSEISASIDARFNKATEDLSNDVKSKVTEELAKIGADSQYQKNITDTVTSAVTQKVDAVVESVAAEAQAVKNATSEKFSSIITNYEENLNRTISDVQTLLEDSDARPILVDKATLESKVISVLEQDVADIKTDYAIVKESTVPVLKSVVEEQPQAAEEQKNEQQ